MNRPFEDIRPVGPFVSDNNSADQEINTENYNPTFESVSDLPESPMLEQYVNSIVAKTGKSEKEVINSKPVKVYMKRLGLWKIAKHE
jgi:hypothetical protein